MTTHDHERSQYSNHHYNRHNHSSRSRSNKILLILNAVIITGLLIGLGFFDFLAAPTTVATTGALAVAATKTATVAAVSTTAAATTGAAFVSLFTLGVVAAVIYGAVGLGYLLAGAQDAYKNGAMNPKARFVDEEGNRKGIISCIGAVLWAPFWLIGGLTGLAVNKIVTACTRPTSADKTEDIMGENPLTRLGAGVATTSNHTNPIHVDVLQPIPTNSSTDNKARIADMFEASFTPKR